MWHDSNCVTCFVVTDLQNANTYLADAGGQKQPKKKEGESMLTKREWAWHFRLYTAINITALIHIGQIVLKPHH